MNTREDIREEWFKTHLAKNVAPFEIAVIDFFLERTVPKSDILAWIEEKWIRDYGNFETTQGIDWHNNLLEQLSAFLSNPNKQ